MQYRPEKKQPPFTLTALAMALALGGLSASAETPSAGLSNSSPPESSMKNASEEAVGDPKAGKVLWMKTLTIIPISQHQSDILGEFIAADNDGNGAIDENEYANWSEKRAQRVYSYSLSHPEGHGVDTKGARDRAHETGSQAPGVASTQKPEPASTHAALESDTGRRNLTAYAMLDTDKQFDTADKDRDGKLGFFEVYYYETFDRPGLSPTEGNTGTPLATGGREPSMVGEHQNVYYDAPSDSTDIEQALQDGAFTAVDENNDGQIALFEASDFSMMTGADDIVAYAQADTNDDAMLSEKEFGEFQRTIAERESTDTQE